MHPTLAARRLDVLRVRLEKDKAIVLGGLDQIEDMARQLHRETGMELYLAIGPVLDATRQEIAGLDVQSPASANRLKELATHLDSVTQVIVRDVRTLATS